MTADTYNNFEELSAKEAGYLIELKDRGTGFVIIGIHGGQIEPGTDEIVRAIAGIDLSYYLFLGNEERQHITSTHFDEKRCIDLVSKSKKAISIHGKKGEGEFIMLGGLDENLISRAMQELGKAGFEIISATDGVTGNESLNICNRCSSGKGLQIEMSRALRNSLIQDPIKMAVFTRVVRNLVY